MAINETSPCSDGRQSGRSERNDTLSIADTLIGPSGYATCQSWTTAAWLVGIVSQRDRSSMRSLVRRSVTDRGTRPTVRLDRGERVMREDVVTTTPDTPITARRSWSTEIRLRPRRDAVVGILSESDIVAAVARGDLSSSLQVFLAIAATDVGASAAGLVPNGWMCLEVTGEVYAGICAIGIASARPTTG